MTAPALASLVRVDRSVRPVYPEWVTRTLHPRLETKGPAEYDLGKDVELYLVLDQTDGKTTQGIRIYEHLKETDRLRRCLGFHDVQVILNMPSQTFWEITEGKSLFCWRGLVEDVHGRPRVPCLYMGDDRDRAVSVRFVPLLDNWRNYHPAALFRKL